MKRLASALLVVIFAPCSFALLAEVLEREAMTDMEEAQHEATMDWEAAESEARTDWEKAVKATPHGAYYPRNSTDGEEKTVKAETRSGALDESDGGLAVGAAAAAAGEKSTSMSTGGEESVADLVGQEKNRSEKPLVTEPLDAESEKVGQEKNRSEKSLVTEPLDAESENGDSKVKPIELVGEAMMCTGSYELKSMKGERETWLIDCGDGESLKVICIGEDCYIQ
jgi:hypothetical protein